MMKKNRFFELYFIIFNITKFYNLGNFPTIADYYVATILMQLEWISFDFSLWPKITQWLDVLKRMQEWADIHEKHRELVEVLTK